MTGTASELYSTNVNINADKHNVNLFSKWLFGKINAKCILHDISQYGCTILIPGSQLIPADEFKVVIMSPDDSEKVHTIVSAKTVWVDGAFSEKFKRIRASFIKIEDDFHGEINLLKSYLRNSRDNKIKCNIIYA